MGSFAIVMVDKQPYLRLASGSAQIDMVLTQENIHSLISLLETVSQIMKDNEEECLER